MQTMTRRQRGPRRTRPCAYCGRGDQLTPAQARAGYMTEQLSMFSGRETLGLQQLKGRPVGPIGGGDLTLKVQGTPPAPSLPIETPPHKHKCKSDLGVRRHERA